jgi:hypothetical protein
MASLRKKLVMAANCAALLCTGAQAATPGEYEVKAAFIHNIAKFVEWPAASPATASARLCVFGEAPFEGALEALRGKQVGKLHWDVVPVGFEANLKECRVLFIAASERDGLDRILESIGNSPVLTIGDTEGYAGQGVIVNFYLERNKVRFEINRQAAARANLFLSSQLLRLARIVPGDM